MKRLKLLAFALSGSVLLLLALGVLLAFTPAVQTWAVRRAVAGQPGLTIELGRVAAGLSSADVTGLRVVKDGIVLTAKAVSVRYSPWDYLANKRINADQIAIQDLVADLRTAGGTTVGGTGGASAGSPSQKAAGQPGAKTPSAAPATGASATAQRAAPAARSAAAFVGVLAQAQLPLDLRVANLTVNGRALLPLNQVVTFDLKAANLATGQQGKLDWTIDFTDPKQNGPLQKLRTTGSLALHIASDRRIDLVAIDAIASGEGPNLPKDKIKLEAKVEQPAAGGDESYAVRLGLLRQDRLEPLLTGNGRFQASTREVAGAWEVTIRSEQLAAVLAGFGLPELAANGKGRFTFSSARNAISASGEIQGQISQLEKLSSALAAVGTVRFDGKFDSGVADNVARLDRLDLEITGADGRKYAQLNLLQKIAFGLADQRLTLANPQSELARLSLQALPLAWAQFAAKPLTIESGEVSLAVAIAAEADGSRVGVRTLEPLTLRSARLRNGQTLLVDQLSLTTRLTLDYSPIRLAAELTELNVTLPAGDALSGKLAAEVTALSTKPAVAFSASLQAKVVSALKPYLPLDPGPLAIAVDMDGRFEDQRLQLRSASVGVNRAGGGLLAGFELLQSITVDLRKNTAAVPSAAAPAARFRLGELPLSWAGAFVPKSTFTGVMAGGTCELALRSIDDLTVSTGTPFTIRGAGAVIDGKALVQALDGSIDLAATKHGDAIGYEVRRIEIKQGNTSLATASAAGETRLGGKTSAATVKGKLEVDAAALLRQPALAPFATLAGGKITTAFEAAVGETIQVNATVAGRNLVARQDNQALGDLDFTVAVNVKADGSGTVRLPFTLTRAGQKSDIAIDGAFGRSAKALLFTGKIAGNQLITDDLQLLGALAPPSPSAPTPASAPLAPAPATRPRTVAVDQVPFWNGVNGKLELDLKKVVYGRDYVIAGIRGSAVVTDARLALDNLEGKFNNDPFKMNAGLTFTAGKPQPYALAGKANVGNLDIGALLRAANPKESPAMETKVTVVANLNGNGPNLPGLVESIYGQFDVTGSPGVLRALGRKGQTVGTLSTIVGLLGAARGSDTTVAASQLAGELNEMRFDKFSMHVDRAADLNLKLTALEFVSASTRVTGTGTVTSQPNVPIENQPLHLQMKIAGKQHMATVLNKAGLLDGKQDDQGYYTMNTAFEIGGTPANPDSKDLWRIIGESTARALLR